MQLSSISLAITRLGQQQQPWTPALFFLGGEQGVWYDPSDFSTMFQDSAGTTPVTAVEQPVGRILDKSGRGNHATQTTVISRPVLSARVNLLTGTETLATQTVTTRATTQTLRFEGTGTVTLSGTATGTYSAGSHSITTTAGNLTLTVSGTVTKADLRATNMGIGMPAYQRVNTATDYDTAGFPHYLRFDGIDDWLVTPSIDFTATDKMTVFAGVRKLSDSVYPVICETYKASSSVYDSFTLHGSVSAAGTGYAASIATAIGKYWSASTPNATAPISSVISLALNSKGAAVADALKTRLNGVQQSLTDASVGPNTTTNNFGSNPLFIGRREGTSLPFNGHLYSLIVRGAQSTDAQIVSAETYVNSKTGAY